MILLSSAYSLVCHFFCEKDGRVIKYKEYFEKNQVIAEVYRFISKVGPNGESAHLGLLLYGIFNKTPCYAGGQQML